VDLANLLIFTGHRLWIFQTHFAAMPQSANEWPPLRATQQIRRLEPDGEAVASVSRYHEENNQRSHKPA